MTTLPPRPNLEHLKSQARALFRDLRSADPEARARYRTTHPRPDEREPALADVQLVIALVAPEDARRGARAGAGRGRRAEARLRRGYDRARERARRQRAPRAARPLYDDPDSESAELSESDARAIVAGEHGYFGWRKYESFLHLEPGVREVLAAIRAGEVDGLRRLLERERELANPAWVAGYGGWLDGDWPHLPNDSVPLFCVTQAVGHGHADPETGARMARLLLEHGADPDVARNQPMEGAVSFGCPGIVRALLDHGAGVEGCAPGVLMAYPMFFGHTECAELLAGAGATLDLGFAAGLGRLDVMERLVDADGSLVPDAGVADPYAGQEVGRGRSPVRAERTRDEVLAQALAYACIHDRRDAAEWLLERGASPSALCRGFAQPCTPLHLLIQHAAERNLEARWRMIERLLESGADPSVRDPVHDGDALGWARALAPKALAERLAAALAGPRSI